jgi:hypothetical protein
MSFSLFSSASNRNLPLAKWILTEVGPSSGVLCTDRVYKNRLSEESLTRDVQRTPEDGPTSVRIHFAKGKFRLDADEKSEKLMPTFDSILDLVKHYCSLSQSERAKSHIWVDNVTGNLYSPICLRKPLKKEVSTLAHTARLAVNQSLKSQTLLPELNLPNRITNYLGEYPHEM